MNCIQISKMFRGLASKLKFNFGGCVSIDSFCRIDINVKKTVVYCVNTLPSYSTAELGHWLVFTLKKNSVIFFDSYALPLTIYHKLFTRFLEKCKRNKKRVYNISIHVQDENSLICGLYALLSIKFLLIYGVKKFKIIFLKMFPRSSSKKNNDNIVLSYFYQHKDEYYTPTNCIDTFCEKNDDTCKIQCDSVIRNSRIR